MKLKKWRIKNLIHQNNKTSQNDFISKKMSHNVQGDVMYVYTK